MKAKTFFVALILGVGVVVNFDYPVISAQTYPPWEEKISTEEVARKYFSENLYDSYKLWEGYKYAIDNFEPGNKTRYIQVPGTLENTKKGDCKALTMWLYKYCKKNAPHSRAYVALGQIVNGRGTPQFNHAWLCVKRRDGKFIILDLFHDDFGRSLVTPEDSRFYKYLELFMIRNENDMKLAIYTGDMWAKYLGIDPEELKINIGNK